MKGTPPTLEELKLLATKWGAAWADPIMGEVQAMEAEEGLQSSRPDLATLDAKEAANLLLGSAKLLRSLSRKERFSVLTQLFSSETPGQGFDLPDGWLKIARDGDITDDQIASAITDRVRLIKSRPHAVAEERFILTLLSVPRDETLRYQNVLTKQQLSVIRNVLWTYAKHEMQQVRDPRSMGWRYSR